MEGMWEVIERRAQREGDRRVDRERERGRGQKSLEQNIAQVLSLIPTQLRICYHTHTCMYS